MSWRPRVERRPAPEGSSARRPHRREPAARRALRALAARRALRAAALAVAAPRALRAVPVAVALALALALAPGALACAPRPAPPPSAPAPPPTRAECEALVERLARIVPDEVDPDREAEVRECLGMPGALLACLETAEAPGHVDGCLDGYLGPPSAADCGLAIDHLRTLDPEFARDSHDDAIDFCVRTKSRFELSCIRGARSMEEAQACERR